MSESIKNLVRTIDNAFSNSSPNSLTIPFSKELLDQLQSFKINNNNDENLREFQSSKFSDKLYSIYLKHCTKNKDNLVSFFLILSILAAYIIDFKSLLYWINECLSNAVNSPGVEIEIVFVSRCFLRSILVSGGNVESREAEMFCRIREINACKLFKILLNLYMTSDLVFYEKGFRKSIIVDTSFHISTENKSTNKNEDNNIYTENKGAQDKSIQNYTNFNNIDNNEFSICKNSSSTAYDDKAVLESHEAKRFINLNIRKLLLEFMAIKPEIAGEIFTEYLLKKSTRFHTLLLLNNLVNEDSYGAINSIFCNDDSQDILDSPLSLLRDTISHVIRSASLSTRSNKILQKNIQNISNNNNLRLSLPILAKTRIFEAVSKCLLFDNDILIIKSALLLFIELLPQIDKKLLNKTILLLLLVYVKLISWNENLNMFFDFKIDKLMLFLNKTCFSTVVSNDKKLNEILEDILLSYKNKDKDVDNSWNSFLTDTNNLDFDFSSVNRLYTLIYGLFPNTLLNFMKAPTDFILREFGFTIKDFIREEHIHIFNENNILYNSKTMISDHLMNPDIFLCTVDDEINSPENLSWYQLNLSGNQLLWNCFKLDKEIEMKFFYPLNKDSTLNILKQLFFDPKKKITYKKHTQLNSENFFNILRMIEDFRVENFGFSFGNELQSQYDISPSENITDNNNYVKLSAENSNSNSSSDPEKLKTGRKQSVISLSSDSNTIATPGISNDLNSIILKQEQLYSDIQMKDNRNKDGSSLPKESSMSNSITSFSNSNTQPTSNNLRNFSHTDSPSFDGSLSFGGTQDEKSMSLSLSNDLSVNYYKRELYLMINEYQFLSMVMSMCNTELQRYKELIFEGFLDKTRQNRVLLLKKEDAAFQRKNLSQVYQKILKEYSLLYRTSINASKDRDKIKFLRASLSKLEDEKNKMNYTINQNNGEISKLSAILKEKDSIITQLMHTIRYLKEITKVDENLEKNNEFEKQTVLLKSYNEELVSNSEHISRLNKEIIKLRNDVESLKVMNKNLVESEENSNAEKKLHSKEESSLAAQQLQLKSCNLEIEELINKNQNLMQIVKQKSETILKLTFFISKIKEKHYTNTDDSKKKSTDEATESSRIKSFNYTESLKRKLSNAVQPHIETRAQNLFNEDKIQDEDKFSEKELKKNADTKVVENRLYFTASQDSEHENKASTQVSNKFVIIDNNT